MYSFFQLFSETLDSSGKHEAVAIEPSEFPTNIYTYIFE